MFFIHKRNLILWSLGLGALLAGCGGSNNSQKIPGSFAPLRSEEEAVSEMIERLGNSSESERTTSEAQLIGVGKNAIAPLIASLGKSGDSEKDKLRTASTIKVLGSPTLREKAMTDLVAAMKKKDIYEPSGRAQFVKALRAIDPDGAIAITPTVEFLKSPEVNVNGDAFHSSLRTLLEYKDAAYPVFASIAETKEGLNAAKARAVLNKFEENADASATEALIQFIPILGTAVDKDALNEPLLQKAESMLKSRGRSNPSTAGILRSDSDSARLVAARLLKNSEDPRVAADLTQALASEKDVRVKKEILLGLAFLGTAEATDTIVRTPFQSDAAYEHAKALSFTGTSTIEPFLRANAGKMSEGDFFIFARAFGAPITYDLSRVYENYYQNLFPRAYAIRALGATGELAAREPLDFYRIWHSNLKVVATEGQDIIDSFQAFRSWSGNSNPVGIPKIELALDVLNRKDMQEIGNELSVVRYKYAEFVDKGIKHQEMLAKLQPPKSEPHKYILEQQRLQAIISEAETKALTVFKRSGVETVSELYDSIGVAENTGATSKNADAFVAELRKTLKHEKGFIRWASAKALRNFGPTAEPAFSDLLQALQDSNESVQIYAALALSSMGKASERALVALQTRKLEATPRVTIHLDAVIKQIESAPAIAINQ